MRSSAYLSPDDEGRRHEETRVLAQLITLGEVINVSRTLVRRPN